MPVPNSTADETEGQGGSDLVTEAEALCAALCDMGVVPAVNLETEEVYVRLHHDMEVRSGAFDLLKVISERAIIGSGFRDDMIGAVSHLGELLAPAPGINTALKTAPVAAVIQALAQAGLLIRHHYEHNDGQTPMLSFMPVPGKHVEPNAHILVALAANRFHEEPEFAAAITRYVVEAGQSQHNA